LILPNRTVEFAKPEPVLPTPPVQLGDETPIRRAMADGASSSGGAGGDRGGGESVVIDYGRRRTTCGYCRSTGPTSISHGTIPEIPSD
jgi:hypothetical protein